MTADARIAAQNHAVRSGQVSRRAMLRRAVALGVSTSGVGSLLAPYGTGRETLAAVAQTPTEGVQRGGQLIASQMGDFAHFDPWITGTPQRPAPWQLFNPLVSYDRQLNLHPQLAESWDVSSDSTTLTVKLRQGVLFHNGREMTADDIVWNVQRMRNKDIGHAVYAQTMTITGAEAVDKYTVRITYSVSTPNMWDALTFAHIIAPESGEAKIASTPIGTGPFKFKEWVPNDHATFVKFEDYWDKSRPYLDEITVKSANDLQAQTISLQATQIQFQAPVLEKDLPRLSENTDLAITSSSNGAFYHLSMNTRRGPFDDKNVRQAIAWSIDRDRIVENVLYGNSTVSWSPLVRESWAYNQDVENRYGFDLDMARSKLAEAGLDSGFEFTCLAITSFPQWKDIATVIQADLRKIGVSMKIAEFDSAQGYPRVRTGDFDATMWHSGRGHKDPASFWGTQGSYSADPQVNYAGFSNEEYTTLVDDGAKTMGREQRLPIYYRLQEIIADEAFAVPIAARQDLIAFRSFVKGFEWSIDDDWVLGDVYLDK